MYLSDIHTHSIASGHGTTCTISDMAKAASQKGLKLLGITDHGPATLAAGTSSYFRSLIYSPRKRFDVELLYGIELNILDFDGTIDMDEAVLQRLDLAIASLHMPCIKPGTKKENTQAFLKVMENPYVDIIGHPGDPRYAVDYRELFRMAKETGTLLEINNASLTPGGFREGSRENIKKILLMSMEEGQPVVLGSDAHFYRNVGDFSYAEDLLRELQFPEELILNNTPEKFLAGLRHGRK